LDFLAVPCPVIGKKALSGLCHLASAWFGFQGPLSVAGNRRPAALPFEPGLGSLHDKNDAQITQRLFI